MSIDSIKPLSVARDICFILALLTALVRLEYLPIVIVGLKDFVIVHTNRFKKKNQNILIGITHHKYYTVNNT